MQLPTTQPTHSDIAWYAEECADPKKQLAAEIAAKKEHLRIACDEINYLKVEARLLERELTDEKHVRRNAEQVTMDAIAKRDQAINDRNLAWAERDNLRAENAALWSSATKLIQNNGGPLQSDEAVERDGQDDYVMVKVQDFEALCAAIDAARREQL